MMSRHFSCRDFEAALDEYIAGNVAQPRLGLIETHLAACPACRELVEVSRAASDVLAGDLGRDFTAGVLAATSGSTCERAWQLIGDKAEAPLEEMDRQLLRHHLDNCRECEQLATTWAWLAPELKEMAELPELAPDVVFTRQVLARTTGARRPLAEMAASLGDRLHEWWHGAIKRPRFGLEMAYVATLLVVVLCGTPVSPLREAPGRALEVVKAGPLTTLGEIAGPFRQAYDWSAPARTSIWGATGGQVVDLAEDIGGKFTAAKDAGGPVWRRVRDHGNQVGSDLKAGRWSEALAGVAAIGGDMRDGWRSLRRSGDRTDERDENAAD